LLLKSVKINLSSPAIFSNLKLTCLVEDGHRVAAARPSATGVFTFAHPPIIPSAMSARLTLAGITPFKSGASIQVIPQGGIIVGDCYGGIIEVSGLPGNLGSVTAQHRKDKAVKTTL
jgi:hypothetical protein